MIEDIVKGEKKNTIVLPKKLFSKNIFILEHGVDKYNFRHEIYLLFFIRRKVYKSFFNGSFFKSGKDLLLSKKNIFQKIFFEKETVSREILPKDFVSRFPENFSFSLPELFFIWKKIKKSPIKMETKSIGQLRKLANKAGLKNFLRLTKDELLDLIEEANQKQKRESSNSPKKKKSLKKLRKMAYKSTGRNEECLHLTRWDLVKLVDGNFAFNSECPICLETDQVFHVMTCKHKIRLDCAEGLISLLCPICRKEVENFPLHVHKKITEVQEPSVSFPEVEISPQLAAAFRRNFMRQLAASSGTNFMRQFLASGWRSF